jgi:hypothetical protein
MAVDDAAGVAARDGMAANGTRRRSSSRSPAAGVHLLEAAAMARPGEEGGAG